MAETTADVRRDIEMTRDRISETLQQLEAKTNVMQIVRDHPWPALAIAVGAGFLLSGSGSDVKAAAATVTATKGASSRIGNVLDDVVASVMGGVSVAFQDRIEALVNEVKEAIGAPTNRTGDGAGSRAAFADTSGGSATGASTTSGTSGFQAGAATGVGTAGSASGNASTSWSPQSANTGATPGVGTPVSAAPANADYSSMRAD